MSSSNLKPAKFGAVSISASVFAWCLVGVCVCVCVCMFQVCSGHVGAVLGIRFFGLTCNPTYLQVYGFY